MIIGYLRFQTADERAVQQHALEVAGCERLFTDAFVSAGALKRPALDQALEALRSGDSLVVWRLDRLGRSLSHLVTLLTARLGDAGIGFRSLSEDIDTTRPDGQHMLRTLRALAEFDRALLAERTQAGVSVAHQNGKSVGRRKKLTPEKVDYARKLIDAGLSPIDAAKTIGVSRATLYRAIPSAAGTRNTEDLFTSLSS